MMPKDKTSKNIVIVPFTNEHVKDAAILEKECFSLPRTEDALSEEIRLDYSHHLAALIDETFGGYIGVYEINGEAYINDLAVKAEFRRMGIAEKLIRSAIVGAEKRNCAFITLEVRKSNDAALALYGKAGFSNVGIRPNFYSKPIEDAIIMTKTLSTTEI